MPRAPSAQSLLQDVLDVIAEVEDLEKTLARFPGLTREALGALLSSKKPAVAAPPPAPKAAPATRTKPLKRVRMWTDGACRGNPGPSSVGVLITDEDGETVDTISERIGTRTNNYAEYEAVRRGLERALELGAESVLLQADSELVVRQLSGIYRVRNADLLPLYEAVKRSEAKFPRGVTYKHVRREQNQDADALANLALDNG